MISNIVVKAKKPKKKNEEVDNLEEKIDLKIVNEYDFNEKSSWY